MNKSAPILIKTNDEIKHHISSTLSTIDEITDSDSDILSYSVFVDGSHKYKMNCTPPEKDFIQINLNKIYPKETKNWVNSDLILHCQSQQCSLYFNILNRKHHCRACGCVFCSKCCNNYIDIPEDFIIKPKEDNTYSQYIKKSSRWLFGQKDNFVCNDCYKKIKNLNEIKGFIKVCEFLDLKSLNILLLVSKQWHNASIHQLSKFRAIQYINPNKLYNEWEMNIIWESRNLFFGHNNWMMPLIKNILQDYYKNRVSGQTLLTFGSARRGQIQASRAEIRSADKGSSSLSAGRTVCWVV